MSFPSKKAYFYFLKTFRVEKDYLSIITLEGLVLKLKLEYFGHVMQTANSLEKTDAGKGWGQEEKKATEDKMVEWHHWLKQTWVWANWNSGE